jgi:hypothetical protein
MLEQVVAHMHFVLHGAVVDDDRLQRRGLRRLPALADILDLAIHADGVDFRRAGIDGDRDAALEAFAARIGHVLEQESLALVLLQAAELPAHQRHQLRVLVDRHGDARELVVLLQVLQMRAQVLQVRLALGLGVHHRCPAYSAASRKGGSVSSSFS